MLLVNSSSHRAALPPLRYTLSHISLLSLTLGSEENVYKLCERLLQESSASEDETLQVDVFAVVISNADERVLLFQQRAGDAVTGRICWDYHVLCIAVTRPRVASSSPIPCTSAPVEPPLPPFLSRSTPPTSVLVYDLDTRLPFPCPFSSYAQRAFLPAWSHPPSLQPLFRVVPAPLYLSTFASDRSHMLDARGRYMAAPPPWPCIGDGMTLPRYRAMSEEDVWPAETTAADEGFGAVLRLEQLLTAFSVSAEEG